MANRILKQSPVDVIVEALSRLCQASSVEGYENRRLQRQGRFDCAAAPILASPMQQSTDRRYDDASLQALLAPSESSRNGFKMKNHTVKVTSIKDISANSLQKRSHARAWLTGRHE